jgi:hypothetical protein
MEQAHDEATATRLIRPAQACSCQASTIAADVPFRWVLGTALTEWDKATTHRDPMTRLPGDADGRIPDP